MSKTGAWLGVIGLGLAMGLVAAAQERVPSQAQVESMRRELQASQRRREAQQATSELVPWRTLSTAPDLKALRRQGAVRLVNDMNQLRAVWLLEPADGQTTETLRVPLPMQEAQWLTLEPGRWRVTLVAGPPDASRPLRVTLGTHEVRRGQAYEINLDGEVEQELKRRLRLARRDSLFGDKLAPAPAEQLRQFERPRVREVR